MKSLHKSLPSRRMQPGVKKSACVGAAWWQIVSNVRNLNEIEKPKAEK